MESERHARINNNESQASIKGPATSTSAAATEFLELSQVWRPCGWTPKRFLKSFYSKG